MPHSPVAVLIHYAAIPGQADVAERELSQLIATVVAREPACLSIELSRNPDDRTRFVLYEVWTDKEAYTGEHMRTPHIREFIGRAPSLFTGPPDITFWDIIHRMPEQQ